MLMMRYANCAKSNFSKKRKVSWIELAQFFNILSPSSNLSNTKKVNMQNKGGIKGLRLPLWRILEQFPSSDTL